jgi:hypothetical protein
MKATLMGLIGIWLLLAFTSPTSYLDAKPQIDIARDQCDATI